MKLYEPQPAMKMYMYDGGWFVLRYVLQNVWKATDNEAQAWFRLGGTIWESVANNPNDVGNVAIKVIVGAGAAGAVLGGLAHYLMAFFIVALFTLIQIFLLCLGVAITSIMMAFLALGNGIYGAYYRIRSRCPVCHREMPIPVYLCPKCSEKHTRLWPSLYGVFYHRCKGSGGKCGEKLPTLGFLGRRNLERQCILGHPLSKSHGATTPIHIPIVGGPAVGKSHLMIAAVRELIDTFAPANQLTVTIPDERQQISYESDIKRLNQGQMLAKTSDADDSASAYNIEIARAGRRVNYLLYLYDAAGEYYQQSDRALQQDYFKFVQGILMVIDPFSIPEVYSRYYDQLAKTGMIVANPEMLDNVYERMLEVLSTRVRLQRGKRYPYPIVVVLTKVDAFDLEQQIGEPAGHEVMKHNNKLHDLGDAMSIAIETFLERNGADNFIRNLHNQFREVRFFSCSALGRNVDKVDTTAFAPKRILDPILWLMSNINIAPTQKERFLRIDRADRAYKSDGGPTASLRHYLWTSLKPIKHPTDT